MENIKHRPDEDPAEDTASQPRESVSFKDKLAALSEKARNRADRFIRNLGSAAVNEVEVEEAPSYQTDEESLQAPNQLAHELDRDFTISKTYESLLMLAEGKLRPIYLSEYKKELIENPFTAMLRQEEQRIKRRGRELQIWENEEETVIKNDVQAGITLQEIIRSERNRFQDIAIETLSVGLEHEDRHVAAFLEGFLQSSGMDRETLLDQIKTNQSLQEDFAVYTRYIGKNMIDRYNYMKKSQSTYLYGDIAASTMADIIDTRSNTEYVNNQGFIKPDRLAHLQGESFALDLSPPGLKDYEIEIPLELFASAEGFDSWQGRGRNGEALADRLPSRDKIGRFAKSDHELVITDISIYMDPSGKVLIKSNNAHRLAAAMQRGQSTIKFNGYAEVMLSRRPFADSLE